MYICLLSKIEVTLSDNLFRAALPSLALLWVLLLST